MTLDSSLLALLADGRFHSGTQLGTDTGRSRSAVWKSIHAMQAQGIEIFTVRGKGYRLSAPVELLDKSRITTAMSRPARDILQHLNILLETGSTNAHLLEKARQPNTAVEACFAEHQTAGRGRRGKTWQSPFGGNIYGSLLWPFTVDISQLGGLSLAVGVAIGRALRECGLLQFGLKWPNDILVDGKKLAGILLEVVGEASGVCSVVIGVGINVNAPSSKKLTVDQPWTDVESATGHSISRNQLVGVLLTHLIDTLRVFEKTGLSSFVDEWNRQDVFRGQEVVLLVGDKKIMGIAQGVESNGALILARKGRLEKYFSGEASLRAMD
ncbi:MAG: bifunctional biotin--[acetyl-CoA-carboxylase] ligase/biotin operon repressor BirA [Gammaproteobacteria bacterium]|nr:bifunctional biotin--[acetyl-CoA-carboxylase] ligase/biotin operon repressor BirA [Gammaproteobacteria bacterium]